MPLEFVDFARQLGIHLVALLGGRHSVSRLDPTIVWAGAGGRAMASQPTARKKAQAILGS